MSYITYCENDSLDKFEEDLNLLAGSSSNLYFLKKKNFNRYYLHHFCFCNIDGILSVSIYEDF